MKNLSTAQYINIALIVVFLIFVGQNLAETEVRFLFFKPKLPLVIVIIASGLFGYITALVLRRGKRKSNDIDNQVE